MERHLPMLRTLRPTPSAHGRAAAAAGTAVCVWIVAGARAAPTVSDVAQVLAPLVAAVACVRAAQRVGGRRRVAWRLLAVYASAWCAGEAAWTFLELFADRPATFPGPPDAAFLLSIPFATAALLVLPTRASTLSRARTLLDGLSVGGSLLFAFWMLVLGPVYRASAGKVTIEQILAVAYPFGDFLILWVVVFALGRVTRGSLRPVRLVAAGLALIAIADSAFMLVNALGVYRTGNVLDVGWIAGFGFIAAGATWVRTPDDLEERDDHRRSQATVVLPYLAVLVPMLYGSVARSWRGMPRSFVVLTGTGVVVLVVVPQLLGLVQRHKLEETLAHRAFHDPLTGLPNRALLSTRIEQAAQLQSNGGVALLFIDIDDFKSFNDTEGHVAGDELLRAIGDRIVETVRPHDTVARLGGDEFAVLLTKLESTEGAARVGDRILAALKRPMKVAGAQVGMRASVGISCPDARTPVLVSQLFREADMALHAAKDAGKGRCAVFSPSIQRTFVERKRLRAELESALDRDEFLVRYQPLVDMRSGRVTGAEALVRWLHPERGILAPATFIGLAEETGLIVPMGRIVLERACAQVRAWQTEHTSAANMSLSVNLSVRQFQEPSLVSDVATALASSGLDPQLLLLEITEGLLLEDTEETISKLRDLRETGVRLAVDDFGTGYSSLGYLGRLPIDVIKIDRSFVYGLGADDDRTPITQAICRLADALGLQVVAEGVERPDQIDALLRMGCREGQGYYFAEPLTREQMDRKLLRQQVLARPA